MKLPIAVAAIALLFFSVSSAHAGDRYIGNWEGSGAVSIEILANNPLKVKYCFKTHCWVQKPQGNLQRMVLIFPKTSNYPGANITMTKSGRNYLGEYQLRSSTNILQTTMVPN